MQLPKVKSAYVNRLVNNPRFLAAFHKPIRIISNKDVPYLAGYNRQGTTVFFDRHFNPYMHWKGKVIDTRNFIMFHEVGENALMNIYGLKYQKAHHIITHFESELVKSAGISTQAYTRFLHPQIKGVYHEKLNSLPRDLDLRAYKDEHEKAILGSLQKGKDIRTFRRSVSIHKRRH